MVRPSLLRSLLVASASLLPSAVLAQNDTASLDNTTTTALTPSDNDCNCGFRDPTTDAIYTDSIIVYFNETNTSVPDNIFSIDSFAHRYEKGWSTYYREGAKEENVYFDSGALGIYHDEVPSNFTPSWLVLNVSAAQDDHLVNGAQVQTIRQDIQYGTFRAFLYSPAPYAGGSALTMKLQYNDTSSAELDLLNQDDSEDNARLTPTVGGADPIAAYNISYQALAEEPYSITPWNFWQYRMDWNKDEIDWYVGDIKTHTDVTTNASLVDTPAAFYLKHWSNGNENWMEGPPTAPTSAMVGYVRLFFNSSVTSTSKINTSGCSADDLCSTEDNTLRVTTPYTRDSTIKWTPEAHKENGGNKTVAIILVIISLAFSAALIIHAIVSKAMDKKRPSKNVGVYRPKMPTSPFVSSDRLNRSGAQTPQNWESQSDLEMENMRRRGQPGASSTTLLGAEHATGRQQMRSRNSGMDRPLMDQSRPVSQIDADGNWTRPGSSSTNNPQNPFQSNVYSENNYSQPYGLNANQYGNNDSQRAFTPIEPIPEQRREASTGDLLSKAPVAPAVRDIEPEGSAAAANPGARPVPPPAALPVARTRVDYLAGLVAVCSLLVSCTHFILTFVPSVIEGFLPYHYRSEYWARQTIGPFFFNEIWVGLFFTTSTRFLSSGYLRTGNLKTIAEKVVCRCPRLMIPITAVILFEYFLMDLGATKWLEYIPSITWSTWPSTMVYPNFGYFIDETLQLFYLIPNAAPQLTWNYCTGVLWTIPVQLQNSWLVLLGVVVICEIKTPWKRMCYYGFCIINHWYALSWGSYFWFGLLLADLDITYKYRKSIHARWWVHYPLLALAIVLVLLSLANDLFSVWTGYTFSTQETAVHPDPQFALMMEAAYPSYVAPKLNGLVFAVCLQYIVELSTWVQAVLSTRVFLWLFPHVFTVYLIHGLVFWSMGSLVCVYFAGIGMAYWLNMLLTALICYTTLFLALPIVTPVMEMLGKEITKGIWVGASEEPPKWTASSYPLSVDEIREIVVRRDDEEEKKS